MFCLESTADQGPIYLRVRENAPSETTITDNPDPKKATIQYDLTPDQYVVCEKTEKGFCIIHGLGFDGSEKTFYLKLEDAKLERAHPSDAKVHMALDSDRVTTAYGRITDYQMRNSNCPSGAPCA